MFDNKFMVQYSKGKPLGKIGLKDDQCVGQNILHLTSHDKTLQQHYVNALKGKTVHFSRKLMGAHFRNTAAPLYDEYGEIAGGISVAYDVSELMEAETAAKKSQDSFSSLVENMHDTIVKIDNKYKIQFTNKDIFLTSRDQCVGKDLLDLVDVPATKELYRYHLTELFKSKMTRQWEWIDDKERSFSTRASMMNQEEAAILVTTDITDRKRAMENAVIAEQAKIASKSKSEFIASMSHELRNPIHSILLTLQLLSTTANISSIQMDYIEDLNENAKLLMAIIRY
jgi:PAS domain S-box-containing protein